VTAIAAAFGDPTRRDMFLFVRAGSGVTAAEVAEQFGVHPNVARHHLDKLVAAGYVEVDTTRTHASVGRPSKRYLVSGDEVNLEIPVRSGDVIVGLLGRALAELGNVRAEQLAEEVGAEYGQAMASAAGGPAATKRSVRAALHAVADALSAHGFAARAEDAGGGMQLVSEHCPFGDAPIAHPVMCAIDRGLVRGMLGALANETGTVVALSSSRQQGDDRCVTDVQSAG
jgi:predicted ArsR family transcriptional regulator